MDIEEIEKTDLWKMYEKGQNYMRQMHIFSDTDRNYRFYNGNQWEGAKIDGIESAQYNFIETIVNYKVSTINQNLYSINYSSENFDRQFRKTAEKTCEMLNRKARKVWEKDKMDVKVRQASEDAAVNDEAVLYVNYDEETESPLNELISKNNIQYGNEQSDDIQTQPYIIISKRVPVSTARKIAEDEGLSEEKVKQIIGDNATWEEAGDDAKIEKDDMCTIVTKLWKENGTVWYQKATKMVDIKKPTNTKLTRYPVAHYIWKNKKGSSRGEAELRYLIPNQIELNKTLARTLLSVKQNAYPQKIYNTERIANPTAIDQVGGKIKVSGGASVDDVQKVFGYVQPAQMSSDVPKLMADLISITRDLRNASDAATGGINPEDASGKAILAVQQASSQPMVKQLTFLKDFIEDIARIWLDMWTVYTPDGMTLEIEMTDPQTDETYIQTIKIPSVILANLKGTVKIDVTPKSAFDKYAQELSLENLLKAGYFSPQMIGQLELYANALPDDSTMPKQKLLDIIEEEKEQQRKIAEINAQAQLQQQQYQQFINAEPDAQAEMIVEDAVRQSAEQQVEADMQSAQ